MSRISIKVVVDDAHRGETEAVCATLRSLGVEVESTMPEIGVIFALAEESLLPQVTGAEGVETAVPEGVYRVPPADGDVPR